MRSPFGNELRYVAALVATNFKACLALRGAFWLQVVAMALNNALFFAMWWILFRHTGEIRGWHLGDMLALYGIVATGFGVAMVTGGGVRDLARAIGEGDLDPVLTQPQSVLVSAVASKSRLPCERRGTTRRTRWTRTTFSAWSTACRPFRGGGWELTVLPLWRVGSKTSAMSSSSR